MYNFDFKNLLIFVFFIIINLIGFLILFQNKKSIANRFFFLLTFSVSLWGLTMFFYRGSVDPSLAAIYARILYVAAAVIPFVFLFFTHIFPGDKLKLSKIKRFFLVSCLVGATIISSHPDFLIQEVRFIEGKENFIVFNQNFHLLYGLYITLLFFFSYFTLFRKIKTSSKEVRPQIIFILIGTLVSTVIGVVTNLIMPFFGYFELNWFGQVSIFFMIFAISYSVYKHKLFDLRIVATQFFVFLIWIAITLRALLSETNRDRLLDLGLLAVLVIIGFALIKSVIRVIKQREQLEEVTKQLSSANIKLQELDQTKTEFLSLASHQLRTPVTAIKGYSSMLLEDNFGKLTKKVREPVQKIFTSSSNLSNLIGDLLDVSKIEQGGMKYEMLLFSMLSLVQSVVDEQREIAKNKNLVLKLETDNRHKFAIKGDQLKIRQVIQNLVDNAIKYTEKGSVTVLLYYNKDKKVVIEVKDTGAGINQETLDKLFQKFSRGDVGGKTNTSGSGLGLYLAMQIVKAHAGTLSAVSDGPGKGSTFKIELPTIY